LKLAGTLRVSELVHTLIDGAAAVAGLAMLTWRAAREQCIQSCAKPLAFAKVASLPSAVVAYDQVPAIGVAVERSGASAVV
jgi:hypothetical protein